MKQIGLPKSLSQALSQMREAAEVADEIIKSTVDETDMGMELVERIEKKMPDADRRLRLVIAMFGGMDEEVFTYRLAADFRIDAKTLLRAADTKKRLHEYALEITEKSEQIDDGLEKILISAMQPTSFGLSEEVTIEEWGPVAAYDPKTEVLTRSWPIVLRLDDDIVYFDCSWLFQVLVPPLYTIGPESIRQQVWTHIEVLRSKQSLTQSYYWEEQGVLFNVYLTTLMKA